VVKATRTRIVMMIITILPVRPEDIMARRAS
jgi:hypothetical protein